MVKVSYKDEWYDVTDFNHPGGSDILADYDGQAIDEPLQDAHMTNQPYEILEEAKRSGSHEGIIYLGPSASGHKLTSFLVAIARLFKL